MSLIKELKRLVQTDVKVSGRVVAVSDTSVMVATASGQIEVSVNGDVSVGDLVTVNAGQATKKQRGGDRSVFLV